ncbi:MAG TPA: chromosome segregation protein SMC [Casimicrobiaceae bacterium]|nr:chromosome segregation protein SMC [Casimicrobiaceae bacterium]
MSGAPRWHEVRIRADPRIPEEPELRLTQIKLAGFKSFVDPTTIATPGQLVGIVGPNGCGKSNVIDAVRWVLGESRASALRGESMQDVIFNGAGERAPVGRASVELFFDNSQGRIGGQWGSYAELSIKRVLTRDGDSTYYINNIPVRRRDIHDLFLGTGLGPRAYAIIEQGMIGRVIEAKPEELRVFLEEAAGVSKYRERRKETESRIADARANLARVEDIRGELASQIEKLAAQAEIATRYREHETQLKQAQHLLWFAKQQDAARLRERHSSETANLAAGLEALLSELRAAEKQVESLRAEQYRAGDELHAQQGGFYAANAEVTRLEQQLQFARDSEGRLAQQAEQLAALLAGLAAQLAALEEESQAGQRELAAAVARREAAAAEEQAAQTALPQGDAALAAAAQALSGVQQQCGESEQALRVAETQRANAGKTLDALTQRRERLEAEAGALGAPLAAQIALVAQQLEDETADLAERETGLNGLRTAVQTLQERQRTAGDTWQQASRALAEREARSEALSALQARIGRGKDADAWLEARRLGHARRLWQQLDIERGWEDALEAVLRERLNALELPTLDAALAWADGGPLPGRIAAYAADPAAKVAAGPGDFLLAKVKPASPGLARLLGDWLAGVRCRAEVGVAMADRDALRPGDAFVTPEGHVVSAQGIAFFAPDSELHGVLARQRELAALAIAIAAAGAETDTAAAARDHIEAELHAQQQAYHGESLALASQQRRCHELELELRQLQQTAEAAEKRRTSIADELAALAAETALEREAQAAIEASITHARARLAAAARARAAAEQARDQADAALERARERLHAAERATQEAGFSERSCRERLSELARRREGLEAQVVQQQALVGELSAERAQIDWAPVEAALQAQLAARAAAEEALAAARDRQEAVAAELRVGEEARLSAEQKLEPARAKIEDMRLKQQAAALAEQQFAEQLGAARADIEALPAALKAWGRASTLPGEIERLTQAIADFGAVNLAALDELKQASERKQYLDAQAQDLTEAMATLESAIRQIDRESRALLQQTFDSVNTNFGKLFPALFGGGQARLVLTGEEILDSGVQVIAQPPGKRNTSIHLLSGGEKAMTAIALVFALFQLNPAPFCLLDEVDAPLDDPNTDRFCAMVRTMADVTQFVFISHNKITMEMAAQLIGITMPDPGVSRVVAVDIAEALELAESPPRQDAVAVR